MIAAVAFEPRSLILLNLILALMMFGVSLSLRLEDFKRVVLSPIAPIAGLFAQFFLFAPSHVSVYVGVEYRSRVGARNDFGSVLPRW